MKMSFLLWTGLDWTALYLLHRLFVLLKRVLWFNGWFVRSDRFISGANVRAFRMFVCSSENRGCIMSLLSTG